MIRKTLIIAGLVTTATSFAVNVSANKKDSTYIKKDALPKPALKLENGFSATLVAEGLDGARHLAVNRFGGIYVKLSKLKDGKGIYYLKDTDGDGTFDKQTGFGNYPGTGIYIKNGYLYASSNDDVFRYKLDDKEEVISPNEPEKIIEGLVNHNRDNSKSIVVDNNNNIYVNVGSYVNACLVEPNSLQAPYPCPVLDSAGGIWQYKANKPNQHFKDGIRYATGLKNIVGLDWNSKTNSLFVMQHGRDQLSELYPKLFTQEQNGLLPAETMYELKKGVDAGWPYAYYDQFQKKKILSPEYGGDGKKISDKKSADPIAVFPAHLAPNGLLFYTGNNFPAKYKNGAFIAFHGKSPELSKGYLVAFVPFKNAKPSGEWEVFADDFAGEGYATSGKAPQHKPCGLAQGPDGALYIADDAGGTIYRIQYNK